jgi:hypothetical protein
VESFIGVLSLFENLECFFGCWFGELEQLEAAFESGVFLEVLFEFRKCCCIDDLDFIVCEGWF